MRRSVRVRPRERLLFPRPWSRAERRVVLQGFFGRSLIAVEPVICFAVFGALTAGLIFFPLPAAARMTRWESAIVLAPIFGLAATAFFAYSVAVMLAPVRALLDTFRPLYQVDGYVRYRWADKRSDDDSTGYVAVLDHRRRTIAEWPLYGDDPLVEDVRPALVEFSFYGGVHRIDGRSTGVLPETFAPLGVGVSARR
jgi:hypothetical protein